MIVSADDTQTFGPPPGVKSNWTRLEPETSPTPRTKPAMTYDPARGEMVLFGGDTDHPTLGYDETWTWDGEDWTLESPANSPPGRSDAMMAFDPTRGEVVLFGGSGAPSAIETTPGYGMVRTGIQGRPPRCPRHAGMA